jgi:hypothetical protein
VKHAPISAMTRRVVLCWHCLEVDPLVGLAMHYQTRMWLQKEAEWKGTAGTTIGTSLKVGSTLNPKP